MSGRPGLSGRETKKGLIRGNLEREAMTKIEARISGQSKALLEVWTDDARLVVEELGDISDALAFMGQHARLIAGIVKELTGEQEVSE